MLVIGKAEVVREGREVYLWALGPWVAEAEQMAPLIEASFPGLRVGVVNGRFAKPLDVELLRAQAEHCQLFITCEDHVINGGFGSAILEALEDMAQARPVLRFGYPDQFIEHGDSVADLRQKAGLDRETILATIRQRLQAKG